MSGRAVEPVEIPPACPFLAFEDDRERRSTAPDHRHRCYAEPRPAPRALAHQERYCLTRDFPNCPTFQAWARREAARESEPGAAREVAAGRPPADPGAWVAPPASASTSKYAPPPPPPAGGISQLAAFDDPEPPPADEAAPADTVDEGAGHAELAALVGGAATGAAAGAAVTDGAPAQAAADAPPFLAGRASGTRKGATPAGRVGRTPSKPIVAGDGGNPPWERPHRNELYPSLRTRSGLPSVPPVALGLTALVVAAVLLFLLPSLLPGNGTPGSSNSVAPSDTAAATSVAPTIAAGPTLLIYTVRSGDLLSTIAARYHLTLAELEAANPQITDPNKIKVGDKITIPTPGASATASQGP